MWDSRKRCLGGTTNRSASESQGCHQQGKKEESDICPQNGAGWNGSKGHISYDSRWQAADVRREE